MEKMERGANMCRHKKKRITRPSRVEFDVLYPTMMALKWCDRVKYEVGFSEWKDLETKKRSDINARTSN